MALNGSSQDIKTMKSRLLIMQTAVMAAVYTFSEDDVFDRCLKHLAKLECLEERFRYRTEDVTSDQETVHQSQILKAEFITTKKLVQKAEKELIAYVFTIDQLQERAKKWKTCKMEEALRLHVQKVYEDVRRLMPKLKLLHTMCLEMDIADEVQIVAKDKNEIAMV
ncbi:hypothetical protein SBOR_8896 [Sclerotinia borealis F-4128]|uniref:Uncharacterized protein n=1 Tax=Sclerotinia borealis (strain F-4128) TaxID=1432307 RepID=W9C1L4_SCLBF|nr:hypothetical protein SBOR_8896 [Sclerotinia borealis F-4128]